MTRYRFRCLTYREQKSASPGRWQSEAAATGIHSIAGSKYSVDRVAATENESAAEVREKYPNLAPGAIETLLKPIRGDFRLEN